MDTIFEAMQKLDNNTGERDHRTPISFEQFLEIMIAKPSLVIRNIFQIFHDMVKFYVGTGCDEYPEDPESIHYVNYDCCNLFVKGTDNPFFADRLFANRLINHVEALKRGTQQNKIYIFFGPHGCGKSTFLNNLLLKFEEYTNIEEGTRFETVWQLEKKILGGIIENNDENGDYVEVVCPSHDNPILIIPKNHRRSFFDDLFKNDEFKWKLFTEKEYEWVFKYNSCTVCSSLYQSLLRKLGSPSKVLQMVYARPYHCNRRLGQGISVFNPGDKQLPQSTLNNPMLQRRINSLFKDSNQVKYIYSQYAKINNGIYALMDIKSNNTERLIELHNVISEGIHKVEDVEENVNSLFIALMNPEDKTNIDGVQSFSDRIEYIYVPYILDLNTETEIYSNIFGKHIDQSFLPMVLNNFARVIISSRLKIRSDALLEWIGNPDKYRMYCDEDLQLLKMEIYAGRIPSWLSEEDRKRLTAKRRKRIISESESEGVYGFSGRDSIKIFNEFYSSYAKKDKLINMSMLYNYFTKIRKDLYISIPRGFLDSLVRMYNYTVLQEVKESLYYYNEEQIAKDIQNYLFAINFEIGAVETCSFTGEKLEITEGFLESIEKRILGGCIEKSKRIAFRKETQKEYASKTLTVEIMLEGKSIKKTTLYLSMYERYVHNLKQKVLDPFLENENFRNAIKDYDKEAFKSYDKRIRDDVTFLMNNLCAKYRYTEQGVKEVCMYVIDNDLAKKFNTNL